MGFDLGNMIAKALESMKNMLDADTIVGKPVYCDEHTMIIPISKISVGFLTGGGELEGKNVKVRQEDSPLGGLGGGLCITPLAFLVVNDGDANIIKIEGDGTERWMEILYGLIRNISKK